MSSNIDPKYLGIPNICFSLTEKGDSREEKFSKQRMERGFDDSETWSLRDTIGNFILPRLKRFKEVDVGFPENLEEPSEWEDILNKMIVSFELLTRDNGTFILTEEEQEKYKEGFELFCEYFMSLWW